MGYKRKNQILRLEFCTTTAVPDCPVTAAIDPTLLKFVFIWRTNLQNINYKDIWHRCFCCKTSDWQSNLIFGQIGCKNNICGKEHAFTKGWIFGICQLGLRQVMLRFQTNCFPTLSKLVTPEGVLQNLSSCSLPCRNGEVYTVASWLTGREHEAGVHVEPRGSQSGKRHIPAILFVQPQRRNLTQLCVQSGCPR